MSFHEYPISGIHYDRPTRQRHELGDLDGLKKSMREVGLINPVVVTSDGLLIAGERRFTAAKELGWSHITVQFREEMTDLERERLEHDENFHRLDLTWQEHTLAVARYHELSCRIEGGSWSPEDSGVKLGLGKSWMLRYLRVAQAIRASDPLVLGAATFSTASGICERRDARKADGEREMLAQVIRAPIRTGDEMVAEAAILAPHVDQSLTPILNTDFVEWARAYTGPKFNLIHCDFPYGIDAGEHDQGAGKAFGGYNDSEDVYWNLISALGHYAENFMAESAHMIFWYSPKFHSATMTELSTQGWAVNPYPLIWHRNDNSGILPDPKRSPRQVYETAFLCSRGDRFLVRAKSNLVGSPNTKQYHMSEKPAPVLEHFLGMLVDDTTTFLDPTCGSANALIVAKRLGAKSVLGIEKSAEFYENAVANWRNNARG